MDSNRTGYGFAALALAFVIGGLIGAGLGFLFAPRTGRETREKIKERGGEHVENSGMRLRPFGRRLKDWLKPEKKNFLKSGEKFRSQLGELRKRFLQKRKKRKQKKRKFFASGVAVVKINNRFGAGCVTSLINRL